VGDLEKVVEELKKEVQQLKLEAKVEVENFKKDRFWLSIIGTLLFSILGYTSIIGIPSQLQNLVNEKGGNVITELQGIKKKVLDDSEKITNILANVEVNEITTLGRRIEALEENLEGVNIKIIPDILTDAGGRFTKPHGLGDSSSILWAAFAMKSGGDSNWYTMTPDNDNPRISENWLYWDDTRIQGEINKGDFGNQPVNLILFLKK
jgi:hypothetical protein